MRGLEGRKRLRKRDRNIISQKNTAKCSTNEKKWKSSLWKINETTNFTQIHGCPNTEIKDRRRQTDGAQTMSKKERKEIQK